MAQFDADADAAAFSKQYDSQQAQAKQQEEQAKQPPTFLQKWLAPVAKATTSMIDASMGAAEQMYALPAAEGVEAGKAGVGLGRDVTAGLTTAAVNTADAVGGAVKSGVGTDFGQGTADHISKLVSPIWDHAKSTILDFRDAISVKDPTLADSLTQAGAQLAIPFTGYSRALGMVHGLANTLAAGAVVDSTALAPHDMRTADLIALGQHTEGKLGDALRAMGPYGLNAYVNYLADRTNETEAQGRFKNVLDGMGANLILTPLLHAAGITLKAGQAGLRHLAENGVRNTISDMVPPEMTARVIEIKNDQAAARRAPRTPSKDVSPGFQSGLDEPADLPAVANDEVTPELTPLERYQAHMRGIIDILQKHAPVEN